MVECYTIQLYLQYDRLMEMGMGAFDSWASRFGETVTALELAPEGTGYRARTRFARFFNLPEHWLTLVPGSSGRAGLMILWSRPSFLPSLVMRSMLS